MSGVVNGTPVDAPTTNAALLAKNGDDSTVGKIGLANTDPVSGTGVTNTQREHNAIAFYAGKALNSIKNILPAWVSTAAGTGGDNLTVRAEALTVKFETTGHNHNGTAGNGGPVAAASIGSVILKGIFTRGTDLVAVSGLFTNVSTQLAGKAVSVSTLTEGVVSTPPYNKVNLLNALNGDFLLDTLGNIVYGRVTNSGGPSGTWTLTYFVDLAGVETAYSFPAPVGVRWFYQFLQNPITGAIVYSEQASMPSDNATQDVLDASPTQRGVVSTGAQSFAGAKTFTGAVNIDGATRLAVALTGILKAAAGVVSAGLVNLATEVSGLLGVVNGGTGADLSATGGTGQYLKQVTVGAAATVGTIPAVDYPTMIGATNLLPGTKGAVPTPAAGDNTRFLTGAATWATPAGGVGKSFVTIGTSGSGADYTTTGTNDDLVFNSAVADAKLNAGGILHILSGTYNFSATHAWASGVWYRGVSRSLVQINITTTSALSGGNFHFSGITFNAVTIVRLLTFDTTVNVLMHECDTAGTFRFRMSSSGRQTIVNSRITTPFQFTQQLHCQNVEFTTLFLDDTQSALFATDCLVTSFNDLGVGTSDAKLMLAGCTVSAFTVGTMVYTNARITGCNFPGAGGLPSVVTGNLVGNLPLSTGVNPIIKSVDQTRVSLAVLTNDSEFVFPVLANVKYVVDGVFFVSCASSVPDWKMAVTTPSGTLLIAVLNATPAGAVDTPILTTSGGSSGRLPLTGGTVQMRMRGTVSIAGVAGNVRLQWSQNTSNINGTTLLAGSTMSLRRI